MTAIRDFIYVDIERLRSLYSQVFEGVVSTIVEAEVDEQETADSQKGGMRFSGSTVAQRVAEASYRMESRILFDHMYNLLEWELGDAVVEAAGLSRETYPDALTDAFMVKVRGLAEIADYQRIKTVFDKFNDIGRALDYLSTFHQRDDILAVKEELWDRIKAEKDRNQKARLKAQMAELERRLKEGGTQLDEDFLRHFSFITDMFLSERLEVTISPAQGSGEVLFRGILDKQWLRVSPELLRALHGGYPAPNWTMVGQLTYVPVPRNGVKDPAGSAEDEEGQGVEEDSLAEPGTLRDAYRTLIASYQAMEKTFTDSEEFAEVIIWPLAIYRETTIPEVQRTNDTQIMA
jgi:hypothetical protein